MAQENSIDDELEEEIEAIKSMYPEQILSHDLDPMMIKCAVKVKILYDYTNLIRT